MKTYWPCKVPACALARACTLTSPAGLRLLLTLGEIIGKRGRWCISAADLAGRTGLSSSGIAKGKRALLTAGSAPKSVALRVAALRSLCLWCLRRGLIGENPLTGLAAFHGKVKSPHRPFTDDELARLLEAAPPERRLWYETAAATGYRVDELRHVTVAGLDRFGPSLALSGEFTKNRKDARQPITRELADKLTPLGRRQGTGRALVGDPHKQGVEALLKHLTEMSHQLGMVASWFSTLPPRRFFLRGRFFLSFYSFFPSFLLSFVVLVVPSWCPRGAFGVPFGCLRGVLVVPSVAAKLYPPDLCESRQGFCPQRRRDSCSHLKRFDHKQDCHRARVVEETDLGRATWHSLRKAFVNAVVRSGADLKTVMELARHSTAAMSMEVYASAEPKRLREAATAAAEHIKAAVRAVFCHTGCKRAATANGGTDLNPDDATGLELVEVVGATGLESVRERIRR